MKHYRDLNNNIFGYEDDGSQDHLIGDKIPLTKQEEADLFAPVDNSHLLTYRDKRRTEYPSIGDQLDDLFRAGVFSEEMASKIQAVKEKYPKT